MRFKRGKKPLIKILTWLSVLSLLLCQSVGSLAAERDQQSAEGADTQQKAESAGLQDESAYETEEKSDQETEASSVTAETPAKDARQQIESIEEAREDLAKITEHKSILALVYLCDTYDVKAAPSKSADNVISVECGQSVQIGGVELDAEGNAWYRVALYCQDRQYEGYVEKQYLATSDEELLEWTEEYAAKEQTANGGIKLMSAEAVTYPDVEQFPASYQNALLALKKKYPNWIFVKMETNLKFNTAVANELGNKSWISSSKPDSWKNGAAQQSGWSYASEGILRYYMDPRNFLTESSIFQFEQLTYNASYHTESAVAALAANSFMSGSIPDEGMTYAQAFTGIGEELKVSPFHLTSRVLQEQGSKGTSPLISGKYSGFEGYYNYFNVGAYGKDSELIIRGLTEAKNRGWDTRYKSLKGGAEVIGRDYIRRGQDTLYLQKFNVTSNNTYNHQYMQNIMAPESEAPSIKKAYADTGSLDHSFVFKIPVYSGMPASACPKPDSTDKLTLNKTLIDSLAVDGTVQLIPYVNNSKVDSLKEMTFTSSKPEVATVDEKGVVKAILPGTATITCSRSGASDASCSVKVVKAEPAVDTPILSPTVYKSGLKLADIGLPAGWSWKDGKKLLTAGTFSYPAVYTPEDTAKYLTVTRQIGIKVSQAVAECDVPENLTAKTGSKLGSIALPAGFRWESDTETILDKAGEQTFYLSYYPKDKNYFELLHIPVVVKVVNEKEKPEESDDQNEPLPDIGGGDSGKEKDSGSGSGGGTGGDSGKEKDSGSGTGGDNGKEKDSGSGSGGGTGGDSGKEKESGGGTGGDSGKEKDSGGGTGSDNGKEKDSGGGTGGDNGKEKDSGGGTGGDSSKEKDSGSGTGCSNDNKNGSDSSGTPISSGTPGNSGTPISSDTPISSGTPISSDTPDGDKSGTEDEPDAPGDSNTGGGEDKGSDNSKGSDTDKSSDGSSTDKDSGGGTAKGSGSTAKDSGSSGGTGNEPASYERPAVSVDMQDVSILTEEMLQIGLEQNVDLILTMNDRAKWYVNAGNTKGGFKDTDMGVQFGGSVIPGELIGQIAGEKEYLELSLLHDGPFGFGAQLEIALDPKDNGRYANLFYYDAEEETLAFICAVVIDGNGYARFPMEHASEYVIIISDHPMSEAAAPIPSDDVKGVLPQRYIAIGIAVAAVFAVLAAAVCLGRKRRREETGEDEEDTEDTEDAEDLEDAENAEEDAEEEYEEADADEDDWIEDEDWQEPDSGETTDPYADAHEENDWIEDDEWDISNDWMDDAEWEKKSGMNKTEADQSGLQDTNAEKTVV